jgi:RluA family pseudouridine synthase
MIKILFQNADYVVIDKPSGIPVHATVDKNRENILDLVKAQLKVEELFLAHRLDKDTSGCLVMSLNHAAQVLITDIFSNRSIRKTYVCVVEGVFEKTEMELEDFLKAKKIKGKELMSVVRSGGKKALSLCRVLSSKNNLSLVEVEIKTGRMHQIRVQLASRGHAIIGDPFYGGTLAQRLFLHAKAIECEIFKVVSEIPTDFMQRLDGK